MTATFQWIRRTLADALMRIVWRLVISPREFEADCAEIVKLHAGQEMHRKFDEASNRLLSSLGYGEGVALFVKHASPAHDDHARRDESGRFVSRHRIAARAKCREQCAKIGREVPEALR